MFIDCIAQDFKKQPDKSPDHCLHRVISQARIIGIRQYVEYGPEQKGNHIARSIICCCCRVHDSKVQHLRIHGDHFAHDLAAKVEV